MLSIRQVNADLAHSATALTAAVATDPDAFECYVACRADSGRQPWYTRTDAQTAEFTAALVAELHGLVASSLQALRSGAINDPAARLSTYEAIDLAHRRASAATALLVQWGVCVQTA